MRSPIQAAVAVARQYGITPDRCDILQDGHTLVVRLTESLVARVVTDVNGPRQGTAWFATETAVAEHLTRHHAPVIPLHPQLPPMAHEQDGFTLNFWQFVRASERSARPREIGETMFRCHQILRSFPDPLPSLAILQESLGILDSHERAECFSSVHVAMLQKHIKRSIGILAPLPHQVLHGDAHMGNLMMTGDGPLWTDWEDAFCGPVEWDLASIIWNVKLLEHDDDTANQILSAYASAGGRFNDSVLQQCLIARAAVMCAWYPILYPDFSPERAAKLRHRLAWLAAQD